ncbi:uncharacterized protein NPIL_520651 [Nephila pilipes]|uniref:VWFC domain-containing protein n=1 Tax=Nephila pilipes TaxID=299642 RepID=A0A8X6NM12_NEPPI|nr:uncharacterized protein NPIL_520651 [Nephila pilipes]
MMCFFFTDYLRDPKNETISSQGTCFYNGTWFQEKEELPTRGLCLICHCFPGFVEPNAFTCSVIDCPWEDYHRRFPGCTPIYADRDCCPIGWECDYGTQNPGQQLSKGPQCDCEWRYLKHYEAKGCRPVYEEKPQTDKPSCTCPWRFDCSQADEIHADDRVCLYKKHVYPVGSKIPTTNPCETCSCATDYFTQAATISCTTTECPAVYSQTPLPEGCHYVYKENQCCPTSVECPTAQKDNMYQVPACEYKGKMYYEGEQIYPDEDPCLICLCNQNWTGINSSSCRQHDCMLERDARKLKQGCIPIYHEKTCCPIDYHCADDDFDFKSNRGASFKSDDDEDEMCFFESRYYPIGHVLDIKHPTNCVTCTCKTPPDFTCIHSSCPPPPNNDYTNCRAVYKPHSCCPDYTCEEKTIDVENTKNEDLNEEKQKDSYQQLIQECKKMQCSSDERCMLVEQKCDKEPCLPIPKCEKVSFGCGQSSCPEGCAEIGSYENNCPLCYCKEQIKEPQYKLTCRVQSCEENCVLTGRDEGGCPVCKCPQGNLEERACASSPCRGFNCTMIVNSLGCAECRCQLSCKPRECPLGCDLDLDVSENNGLECGCQCKNSTTAVEYIHSKPIPETCKNIDCQGQNCTIGEDKSDCPYCNCKAPCPTPVCQEGCQVEKTTQPGRCPGCVCKLSRSIRDNKAKECPPPTCLGYNCSVITGENGCQKCLCESPCEEAPQCPSHCKLETNVPEGRCRGCVCSFGEQADSNNKPHRGGGKVPEGEDNDVEPEKREDLEADFIPLPGKELVPGVDKIFLIHGDNDQDQYAGVPGYHYDGGHAYPVFGEPLESGLYNVDDHIPGEFESSLPDEAREEVDEGTSENRNEEADYAHDEEGFVPEYAEEKAMEDDEDEKCAQKNCPEGQKCVIRRLQCIRTPCPTIPVCIDVEPRCPIPMCAIGCMVMKWDDEVCPSCFCGIIRGAEGRVCPRTRCMGRRCYNVIGDDGCPQCKCDSICIPPKCTDGCFVEKEAPAGKCPTCTCPDRSSVVQPIIPGTSPADNTTGPIVENGSETEKVEDSEDSESNDKILPAAEETDDIQGRDPSVLSGDGPSRAQEKPESVDRNKLLEEDLATEFYNTLAEIEEEVKSSELTTVTVNLPTTIDAADIFDISSTNAPKNVVTEAEIQKYTTLSSDSPDSTTEQKPTTLSLNSADENLPVTSKPCMIKPNTSGDQEDVKPIQNSEIPAEGITYFTVSTNEKVTPPPKTTSPNRIPSTRKPQRRPVTPSNKNPSDRLKPQSVNNRIKPKPPSNADSKRPSNSHSSSSSSSQLLRPVPKPQDFESYIDDGEHEEDMKPILQNLQQLMSNLHHVLSSHQRPSNIEEAFEKLQSNLRPPAKIPENSTSSDKPFSLQDKNSVINKKNQSEIENQEKGTDYQNNKHLESNKNSEAPDQKLSSENTDENVTDAQTSSDQTPQSYQNAALQQQYFVNPNILSSQSLPNQQVVPSILQQGVQSQFHLYPQFPYQNSQSNIQAMGIVQPQIPYQSHLQSLYNGGQNPIFNGQPQTPYYPSIQHPSFITSVNPFHSDQYTQAQKQQLLLTNIPIPPSLQQQLNAGTQTLGFLQHLLNQNNPFYQQQLLKIQQQQQMNIQSTDNKPVGNLGVIQEPSLFQTSTSLNEKETMNTAQSQQQNIYGDNQVLSNQQQLENAEVESQHSYPFTSINEQVAPSIGQVTQQNVVSSNDQQQEQQQVLINSSQPVNIPVQQQHEINTSLPQVPAVIGDLNVISSNHRPSTQILEQDNVNISQPMPAFPAILGNSSDSLTSTEGSSFLNTSENTEHSQINSPTSDTIFNHHAPQGQQTDLFQSNQQLPVTSFQGTISHQQPQLNGFSQQQQQHLENLAQQYQQLQEQLNQLQSTQQQYVASKPDPLKPSNASFDNEPQNVLIQTQNSNISTLSHQQQQFQQTLQQTTNAALQEQTIRVAGTENIPPQQFQNADQVNIPSSFASNLPQGPLENNVQYQTTEGKDGSKPINVHQSYISNHNAPLLGQQQFHQIYEHSVAQLPSNQQATIHTEQIISQNNALANQQQNQEQTQHIISQEIPQNQPQIENQRNQYLHNPQVISSYNEQAVHHQTQQYNLNKVEAPVNPLQITQHQQMNAILNQQPTISDEKQHVSSSSSLFLPQQINNGHGSGSNIYVGSPQQIYNPQNSFAQTSLNQQQNNNQPDIYVQEKPLQTELNPSQPILPVNGLVNQQINQQYGNLNFSSTPDQSIQQQNTYFQYNTFTQPQAQFQGQYGIHPTQHQTQQFQGNSQYNHLQTQMQNTLSSQSTLSSQQFLNAEDKLENLHKAHNETNAANFSVPGYQSTIPSQQQTYIHGSWNNPQQQTIQQIQHVQQQGTLQLQQHSSNENPLPGSYQGTEQQYLQQQNQNLGSNDRPIPEAYPSQQQFHIQQQGSQQHYVPNETPLPHANQNQQQQFNANQKPLSETYQGQQQHYLPQQQQFQQHQFNSNEKPLPGSYPAQQQYQPHIPQQTNGQQYQPLITQQTNGQQYQPHIPQQTNGQQQQYINQQQHYQQQQNIQQFNQPQMHLQQQQNSQQQYLNSNERPSSDFQTHQFLNTHNASIHSGQQQQGQIISTQQFVANEKPLISQSGTYIQQSYNTPVLPVYQVNQIPQQQNQIIPQQQFVGNEKPLIPVQPIQHQQQFVGTEKPLISVQPIQPQQQFVGNENPLISVQPIQHQQHFNANEKPLTPMQQSQHQFNQPPVLQVQTIQQNQNIQQNSFDPNTIVQQQGQQQYLISQAASTNILPLEKDNTELTQNLHMQVNGPFIQSQQTSTQQDQVNSEDAGYLNNPLHQQYVDSENNDPSQHEFQDQDDTDFSEENLDQDLIDYSNSEVDQNQQSFLNADPTPIVQTHNVQQHNVEDKYSALKPLAQIVTAEPPSNQHHHQSEDNVSILGPNEAAPIQQVLEDLKPKQNDTTYQSNSPNVAHKPPSSLKTRPGSVVRPHFAAMTPKTTTTPPSNHDLFPAPSRPINNKPSIQQQDLIDQEFVEDDSPQEMEAFDYEDFEVPESTTISTSEPIFPYRKPLTPSQQEPTNEPPVHLYQSTNSEPLQHEILENFDNHQPDSVRRPIDQQQIIDEFKSTSQKYFFMRTSTTPRPYSKFPLTPNAFASFSTVSPTAEAYSASKYSTKTPLSPIPSYQCPTPHCNGYNCSLIRGSDGCQKCVCDSPCAPCPQHCVKTKTLSEGRCPICDCTVAPPLAMASPTHRCPPVDCNGSNCRKVRDNDGCMTCICDPKCVEPQCDPGCEVLRDVPPGQCPGCVCRVTVVQAVVPRPRPCSAIICGKNCKETRGPDGCPSCVCNPECPPPKCDRGCTVQTDVAAGQCPTCVCTNFADDDDDDDDDLYCPNLFCSEYGCREIPGPAGCPICMCDPICKTPVCEPGCQVVSDKYHGRCPVCLCSNPINGSSAAEPTFSNVQQNNVKTVPVVQHPEQEQAQVTFSGLIEAVEAEEEPTASTLHTTVTVELDTFTEEQTTEPTTEEPTTTCPAPVCSGLRCSMEMGDDGCEVCKCKYKCPKPKCVGNCYAETNAPSHRCPGCVCPTRSKPPKY